MSATIRKGTPARRATLTKRRDGVSLVDGARGEYECNVCHERYQPALRLSVPAYERLRCPNGCGRRADRQVIP